MSSELKQAVQQALDAFDAFGEDDDFSSLFALEQKMEALRTAIKQATQPAEVTDDLVEKARVETFQKTGADLIPEVAATFARAILALPTLRPGDSHMESLIEAAIQGHADTREAMRWLVRQLVPATQAEAHPGEPVYQICKADSVSISTAWVDVQKQQYDDAAVYPEYGRRVLYTCTAQGVPEGFALVPLKATPKVAMVLYEGARNCFSPKVAEGLWQDALTAAQAQKGGG